MRDVSIKLLTRAQRDTDRIDFYFQLLQNLSVGLIVNLAGRDINCLIFHLLLKLLKKSIYLGLEVKIQKLKFGMMIFSKDY